MEENIINIEILLTNLEKKLEDLSEVVIYQGKQIQALIFQNQQISSELNGTAIKSQKEETPPPHY